jgi:hypothetical protein
MWQTEQGIAYSAADDISLQANDDGVRAHGNGLRA